MDKTIAEIGYFISRVKSRRKEIECQTRELRKEQDALCQVECELEQLKDVAMSEKEELNKESEE